MKLSPRTTTIALTLGFLTAVLLAGCATTPTGTPTPTPTPTVSVAREAAGSNGNADIFY